MLFHWLSTVFNQKSFIVKKCDEEFLGKNDAADNYSVYCLKIFHWKSHSDISIPRQITESSIEAGHVKNKSTWHNAIVSFIPEGLFSEVRATYVNLMNIP